MYADRWSPGLRQGDVLGTVFLPLLGSDFKIVAPRGSLTEGLPEQPIQEIIIGGENRFVVVVSHDCEFNEDKRNKLLVARLQNVPGNLSDEERADLRESNNAEARVAEGKEVSGIDNFVFAPLPGAFDSEQIASFTTITPLPMGKREELRAAKWAELNQEHRVLFRKKLGLFFARDAEDIPDEEKEPARPPMDAAEQG